jgi:hypothetical protein
MLSKSHRARQLFHLEERLEGHLVILLRMQDAGNPILWPTILADNSGRR